MTLAERWDGTSWSVQPTPNPSGIGAGLTAVSCVSASSCVAVGGYINNSSRDAALAERWNGSSWTIQPLSVPGAVASDLFGVSCVSAAACTAVGSYRTSSGGHTLALHWNGSGWAVQSTPNPTSGALLLGVACGSSVACTAVGGYTNSASRLATLAMSWNGSSWATQPTVDPAGSDSQLRAVSCPSAATCTAVGESAPNSAFTRPLVEHR